MSLARRAVSATMWVAVSTYTGQLVAFLANIALMRLIAPEAFGVLAMAVVLVTFGRKLIGFGFNHALIHRQEDLPDAVGAHLTLNAGSALLIMAAGWLAFPFVAQAYDRLTALVLIGVTVEAACEYAGFTPRLLLEKRVEFRSLMLLNLGITVGINVVSVLAALLWPNVWVLLLRVLGAQLAAAVGYWLLNRRIPLARPTRAMLRWYFGFGAPLWIAGIATFAVLQLDDFLVGTMVSQEALGYYSRAYALAVLPTTMVGHIVARVAFPLYSQLQKDRERLSEAFSTVMRMIVLLAAPAAVGLAYCAPEFVQVVFGEKWLPMVPLVRWLLLYELLRPLFDDVGELFTAIGKPRLISRIQLVQAGLMVALTPLLVWLAEASGAAIAVGIVMLVGVLLAYRDLRPHVTVSVRSVILTPMGLCVAAAAVSASWLPCLAPDGALGRLLVKVGLFIALTAALFAAVQGRVLWREFRVLRARLTRRETT